MRNDIKNWVFSCDMMSYNVISAFKELNEVDWGSDKNVMKGDYVYIYLVAPIKKIILKTKVVIDNIGENEFIDDSKFMLKEITKSEKTKYIRLKLITSFSDNISNMLTYEILRQNGLNGPIQGPLILNNNKILWSYIDKIENKQKVDEIEKKEVEKIIELDKILSRTLGVTEKDALIKIRIGQGLFKKKLEMIECQCKICGLKSKKLLIASHIKPWKDCNDNERLDDNNGFLLCPNHDALFDKGYICFGDDGKIMISKLIEKNCYKLLNISSSDQIALTDKNKGYLKCHRDKIFKR
ncbi:HNH endonuclease [Clostridium estertheticum]|uniref:HNH endonuclease n=1 Tax=Clostridium estertheticum TaxID=238834 RepID=UPI001C0D6EAC|nr:HNH endonuclease [Clostridium estertheticum]MBU3071943.1 HNH endonuclease [Clostridium estertheticum]MBU3162035.1 HNH endonuclease [Clostridium estertheticum]